VKLFECEQCAGVLFFENTLCRGCNAALGYCVESGRLTTLPDGEAAQTPFPLAGGGPAHYRRCQNYSDYNACNWLVAADDDEPFCRSCRLTEIVPDLSDAANKAAWFEVEGAKRRLLYTLYSLRLPVVSKRDDEEGGVTFRFLHGTPEQPVMTGHDRGIITLNMAEADTAFRENMRVKLGEGYRTVLGHLRHEIGHYYWDRLIQGGPELEAYRALFGDEREDYQTALDRHYAEGPKSNWAEFFISAYATMHPWEDWAESWAHYLHMLDTLETAKSHGLTVRVPGQPAERVSTDSLPLGDFDRLASRWHAVALALNSLTRSMGVKDVYPFVLSSPVLQKLAFIHRIIAGRAATETKRTGANAETSLAGSLRTHTRRTT
jgi:hypothetical protein